MSFHIAICANDPADEREALENARDDFCRQIDNINDAIGEEFADWNGDELAEAIRDEDIERVGLIVLRRVGRMLQRNASILVN